MTAFDRAWDGMAPEHQRGSVLTRTPEATHTHDGFFDDLLVRLGLPSTPGRRRALAGVSLFESSQGQLRWWNSMAVITVIPGSKPLYPGVVPCAQIYPSYQDGLDCTASMWAGPHWQDVRLALAKYDYRKPIMAELTAAYTWVTPRPDFYHLYTYRELNERRRLQLLGPK